MDFDDVSVKGTKLINEVYERVDIAIIEPTSYKEPEALQDWKEAMLDGMDMIHKNQTWELVERLVHKIVIGVKWAFKAKHYADGTLNKLKAEGFSQKYDVDYFETFAPVARLDIIKLLLALVAQRQ
ncbi:uncharacterized mitochondrial protein AtMg00820-like [Gossypium hirsutum]|uniref:Uncharacterized mitochondrial protein AtMg00820-like n=1 Tax=Gossypium hirsutum TaxID=3635 RepID=A0A1U8PMK8_GOSHI|nr:uncharacterized mitochondrial protein AtMg00820-like [Gossypium hirsutum]